MQIQLTIAPPANAAQADIALGNNANAGEASFSQLLSQAAPRENAAASSAERANAAEDQRAWERSEHAHAGDRTPEQAGDAQGDEAREAITDAPVINAVETAAAPVAAPQVAPVDTSLATCLPAVAAALMAQNAAQSPPAGDALPDAAATRAAAQSINAMTRSAEAAAATVRRLSVDGEAKGFAAGFAPGIVQEAQRGAEIAVAAQLRRLVRADDAQPLADAGVPAAVSLAATGAPLASTAPAAAAAPTAATSLHLPHPVGGSEFAPALALTLTRLARDGVQEARLQLHPAEMGPIDVRIAVDGAQARIDFSADVAATRTAIEAGLPMLAGALRESGLTLAGGGVFQHARDRGEDGATDGDARGEHGTDEADAIAAPAAPQRVTRGVVDLYA